MRSGTKLIAILILGTLLLVSGVVFAATTVPFTVNMSEAVTVTGTPRIAVDVGGVTRYATYASGTGTSALTFNYAMVAGDIDLDGVTLTSPIDLNGGTLKDLNGNDAALTFTVPNTSNVKISYPSLSMDFTTDHYTLNGTSYASLASFLTATSGTFSRTSTATYFDSAGVLQTAASGAPRFDYDPITHAAKGILIEESRTNILKQSNAFTTAPWDTSTCGGLTNSGSTTTAPDGSTVPIYNFSTTGCVFQDVGVTIGNSLTHSVWIKANQAGTLGFRTPGTGATTSTAITVGTSWQRYNLTATAVAATSRFLIDNRSANGYGVAGLQISFFGGQMEVGAFPTSYIATTAASVTRSVDDLRFSTTGWFNGTTGTWYAYFDGGKESNQGTYGRVISYDGSTAAISTDCGSTSTIGTWNGTSNICKVTGVDFYTTAGGAAAAYNQTALTRSLSARGLAPAAGSYTGTYNTTGNVIRLGSNIGSSNLLNGHIQKIKFYPARISDTQLQLLTQ